MSRHRVRLFHSLHLLHAASAAVRARVGQIRVSTRLWLRSSVLGVLPIFHTSSCSLTAYHRVLMRRRLFARRPARAAHLRNDLRRAVRRRIRTVRRVLLMKFSGSSSLIRRLEQLLTGVNARGVGHGAGAGTQADGG